MQRRQRVRFDMEKAAELLQSANKLKASVCYSQNPFYAHGRKHSKPFTKPRITLSNYVGRYETALFKMQHEESNAANTKDPIIYSKDTVREEKYFKSHSRGVSALNNKVFTLEKIDKAVACTVGDECIGVESPDYTENIEEFDSSVKHLFTNTYLRPTKTKCDCLKQVHLKLLRKSLNNNYPC